MEIGQDTTVQVITTTQIIKISGASAIAGSLITLFGIWLKSVLESKDNKKTRLFEARRTAYSTLIGHLKTSFTKYDIQLKDYEPETILKAISAFSVNLDYVFSDALLVSGDPVKTKIEQYKQSISSLKASVLNDAYEQKLNKTFKNRLNEATELNKKAEELIKSMREELEIK